jgi:hypothetical protein
MDELIRELSPKLKEALAQHAKGGEAESGNWWIDILKNPDILLAIRGGYFNAYHNGQSILKIGPGVNSVDEPTMKLHYKYLLKPNVKPENVSFDGAKFGRKADELVQTKYTPGHTLKQIVATADLYAGTEKRGVHAIAKENANVVDLEIAFSRRDRKVSFAEPTDEAPTLGQKKKRSEWSTFRMDLAAIHPGGPTGARIVFFEAKCADNVELWTLSKETSSETPLIEVVKQIRRYETFLKNAEVSLIEAYTNVCKQLREFREQGWVRKLDDLASEVAEDKIRLSIHPQVFLLIFGFDDDKRNGKNFKRRMAPLKDDASLKGRVIERGNPSNFNLVMNTALGVR